MSSEQLVVQICGPYPENFEPVQILSDEIYIFENDPNYSAVKVFDIDKNAALAIQNHFGLSNYQILFLSWLKGLWTGILISLIAHYFIKH